MKNRFKDEDKIRVWGDFPYCQICRSNQNCSLHHIDGCKEDLHRSILNSIMLCHNHHKEADGYNTSSPKGEEMRKRYREASLKRFEAANIPMNKHDEAYFAKYHSSRSE